MIKVTSYPLSPEEAVEEAKTNDSGCVVTYVGLIRDTSRGKEVASVEYRDSDGKAEARLREIAEETERRWNVNRVAIHHRVGVLKVGDINLVIAVAAGHRREGLDAAAYAVDCFKERLPTAKKETYRDSTVYTGD